MKLPIYNKLLPQDTQLEERGPFSGANQRLRVHHVLAISVYANVQRPVSQKQN
jgi:hypothetical protein